MVLVGLVVGCGDMAEIEDDPRDGVAVTDGKGDGNGFAEGTPDGKAILRVANATSLADLDNAVGLSTRAATGIVAQRPFDSLTALDAVPYVGRVVFGKLLAYSQATACIPQTPAWESVPNAPNGFVVFDSVRDRLVSLTVAGTRELADGAWLPPHGDPLPADRAHGAAIAYDPDRGRAVLVGTQFGMETWEWDGASDSWTNRTTSSTPDSRKGHAMAYDSVRKQVVLFGGQSQTAFAASTWTWDGVTWRLASPETAAHPEPMMQGQMAFDPTREKVVLYGASWGTWPLAGSTWEWDGTGWEKRADDRFFPYSDATDFTAYRPMAFDARRGRVLRLDLLSTGLGGASIELAVREWDGAQWSLVSNANAPAFRDKASVVVDAAYDAARDRFVLANHATGETVGFFWAQHAPELEASWLEDDRAFVGRTLTRYLVGYDKDGDPLTYDVSPMPAGATIEPHPMDPNVGVFTWTPTAAQAGNHLLTAKASDGCGESTESFSIQVDSGYGASLPQGNVQLAGTAQLPLSMADTGLHKYYKGTATLSCVARGANPGQVTVTCTAPGIRMTSLVGGAPIDVVLPTMDAPLDGDLTFGYQVRRFAGQLEPLSDGTYKLTLTRYSFYYGMENPQTMMEVETDAPGTYGHDGFVILSAAP